jgi:L-aspartate oxidase
MTGRTEPGRYLVNIDTATTQQLFTDCLVVGAGIAGLRAAIEAAAHCRVVVVCKGTLEDSNTWNAQGGIASVLDAGDSIESHVTDTLNTGCGLSDAEVVELVVRQGPALIEQLLGWGAGFDIVDGHIATTLEGGHSRPRVIHAHGDETGRIIAEVLIKQVRQNPSIRVMENFFVVDLLTNDDNECVGVVGQNGRGTQIVWAANTVLATGGAGDR